MRAVEVSRYGGPEVLQVVDRPAPTLREGQVRVAVKAIGVNYLDVQECTGAYPRALPYIPGDEGSGTIIEVGPGVDRSIGERVCWQGITGSYAEELAIPADRLIAVPDGISDHLAAALPTQGLTAHYLATDAYQISAGDVVVILAGAGGVGLLLTQIAKLQGAYVITAVSTPEKAHLSRKAGADQVVAYADLADAVHEASGAGRARGVPAKAMSAGAEPAEAVHAGASRAEAVYVGAEPVEVTHAASGPAEAVHVGAEPAMAVHAGASRAEAVYVGAGPEEVTHAGAGPAEAVHLGVEPAMAVDAGASRAEVADAGAPHAEVVHVGAERAKAVRAGATHAQAVHVGAEPAEVALAGVGPAEAVHLGVEPAMAVHADASRAEAAHVGAEPAEVALAGVGPAEAVHFGVGPAMAVDADARRREVAGAGAPHAEAVLVGAEPAEVAHTGGGHAGAVRQGAGPAKAVRAGARHAEGVPRGGAGAGPVRAGARSAGVMHVGADVVYDSVGGATFEESLAVLRRRGTLVLYGQSSGAVPPFDLMRLRHGSLTVIRPTLRDYVHGDELQKRAVDLFAWVERGYVTPQVGGIYQLEDVAQAHADLEGRRTSGKLLLVP
ncbi:zinc-binding dehydrogenase [Kribbella lupini]|uniref:Enoyl reductase (ER) domain-containing protein n=1 Tax=Kribbella lupini TaxID=291602 RepID=A0ABN1ZZB0_9ACTN